MSDETTTEVPDEVPDETDDAPRDYPEPEDGDEQNAGYPNGDAEGVDDDAGSVG